MNDDQRNESELEEGSKLEALGCLSLGCGSLLVAPVACYAVGHYVREGLIEITGQNSTSCTREWAISDQGPRYDHINTECPDGVDYTAANIVDLTACGSGLSAGLILPVLTLALYSRLVGRKEHDIKQ
jgi:hypothetical protein